MQEESSLRSLHWSTILICALSLSIGWGIRGNFGHEYGAMIPGCLTAIAVCLCSGREDWRARLPYFALFGTMGWGFGGSISYMQVIAYTHSGHLPSQAYGFFCLFVIGFLWAAMGGFGTSLAAVMNRKQLTDLFRPLLWILVVWALFTLAMARLQEWESQYAQTWSRHESPLYWFDSDWLNAVTALLALFLFDLWDQRRKIVRGPAAYIVFLLTLGLGIGLGYFAVQSGLRFIVIPEYDLMLQSYAFLIPLIALITLGLVWILLSTNILFVAIFGVAGAGLGGCIQFAVVQLGKSLPEVAYYVKTIFLQHQGDTVQIMRDYGVDAEGARSMMLINWPDFFLDMPGHIGWILGLFFGICLYFRLFGKFRAGATLFLYMAVGWLVVFLLFPVFLGFGGEGFRMTPPRSDDWAGIVGVVVGTMIWCYRNKLLPSLYVLVVCGTIGGLGFAGAAWLKLMLVSIGNPNLAQYTPEQVAYWSHWQGANWHSFLEQSYGFINGIAVAVGMGFMAWRTGAVDEGEPGSRKRWTEIFAVSFVLFFLLFVNIEKNVPEWVKNGLVQKRMTAPLIQSIELSAWAWFSITWGFMALVGIGLMVRHGRTPIALIPKSWTGRGQLLYLVFLWAIVIANFERALPQFDAGRLITEWVIFIHAIVATALILVLPRPGLPTTVGSIMNYKPLMRRVMLKAVIVAIIATGLFTYSIHRVYGDTFAGHAGLQTRFGEDATWRHHPNLRNEKHQ